MKGLLSVHFSPARAKAPAGEPSVLADLISMSTPRGQVEALQRVDCLRGVVHNVQRRLCTRISTCSRLSLCLCDRGPPCSGASRSAAAPVPALERWCARLSGRSSRWTGPRCVVEGLQPDADHLTVVGHDQLLQNLYDAARTHGAAAFADGEGETLFHGDGLPGHGHFGVVTGHDHLRAARQLKWCR